MKTNSKEVCLKIQKHIKNQMNLSDLKANVNGLLGTLPETPTIYSTIKYMVQGGSFLAYYYDIKDFLNRLGINPENKEYTDEKSWELYQHLIAREGEKLLIKLNK